MAAPTMQRAMLMMIGLALAGCSGVGQQDNAGAPRTTAPGPAATSVDGSPTGEAPPGATSASDATSPPSGSGNTSPAAPGATSATGGQAPDQAAGGGAGGSTEGGTAPETGGAPSAGSTGSSGSSGSSAPRATASPEDCAALRAAMAIVDHPDLHQLKAEVGC